MPNLPARLAGVELYFDDLERAQHFYVETLGLRLTGEQAGHHAQFDGGGGTFLCLEKKGVEDYPSHDKAVVFLEVPNLQAAVAAIGRERVLRFEPQGLQPWAVLHDPEGHSVLLLQAPLRK